VEDGDVEVVARLDAGDGIRGRGRGRRPVAPLLDECAQHLAQLGLVVHDEHVATLAGGALADLATVDGFVEILAGCRELSAGAGRQADRKSTRLNSSHVKISYADLC